MLIFMLARAPVVARWAVVLGETIGKFDTIVNIFQSGHCQSQHLYSCTMLSATYQLRYDLLV